MSAPDPFLHEVLRHRLASIAHEGAIALQRVSGSPLATEAFDLNTSIMSATGEVAFAGPFLLTGPVSQGMIARTILAGATGIRDVLPGDMYLSNDPYVGAAHQNCVTLVAPIHAGAEVVAWAGATLHLVDVGGPTAGQVGLGARSIHDEAPPVAPVRIVAGGEILPDVEAAWIERSRTPELNALDLRAKIAALNTIGRRVLELVAQHGVGTVRDVIGATIEDGAAHLRRRISELPDEPVVQSAWLDHADDGATRFHEIRLRLVREGDRLVFDFTGSSPQAPAVVNCTRSGLRSGVLVGTLTTLVWDAPWCPASVERAIEVRSEPGTVVDATWPAGCSMATMGAGFAATTASALGMGRLLAASDAHRDRAMASWAGAVGSVDVFGADPTGRPFGTVLLDSMASGTGARAGADGIDSGGFLRSISCVVSNVEQYEARFPLLYLWRRQEPDTGGPGRRRGGSGVSFAVVPHGVPGLPTVIPHFAGTMQPESGGLEGGYPGATNDVRVVRDSGVRAAMAAGRLPTDTADFGGQPTTLPGVVRTSLEDNDVLVVVATGGGGWGDPIERDPDEVARDIRASLVSADVARAVYGVALDVDGRADAETTAAVRASVRERRAGGEREGTTQSRRCPRCGAVVTAYLAATRPLSAAGPHVAPHQPASPFSLVERYCPGCLRLVEVERVMTPHPEEVR